MAVPGRAGFSILGDESLEFWRGPMEYIEKRRLQHGHIFLGRILNKPTIFLTSNAAVKELLIDKWSHFTMGYREFMFDLFGENLLFLDGDIWQQAREKLERAFDHNSLSQSLEMCKQLISDHFKKIPLGEPIVAYQYFKTLTTQLSIKLFLSHLITDDEAKEISELMTTHWHGIISVPLNIRVPGLLWKSGYGKAITAKERLLEIISEKLKYQPSEIASGIEDSNNGDLATRNILLFISALIPKALASLMTSLIVALAKPENIRYRECVHDDVLLEEVVLECQRMWPPFLGGRRICTESCTIGGYTIPEGHGVAYISHISNRDKLIFKDPDKFRPERWRDENSSDKDLIWTYGGGPRACIGRHLSTTILKEWLHQLLSTLQWDVTVNEDTQYNNYKVLPVFRPSDNIHVRFTSLPTTSHDNDDVITTDINTEL